MATDTNERTKRTSRADLNRPPGWTWLGWNWTQDHSPYIHPSIRRRPSVQNPPVIYPPFVIISYLSAACRLSGTASASSVPPVPLASHGSLFALLLYLFSSSASAANLHEKQRGIHDRRLDRLTDARLILDPLPTTEYTHARPSAHPHAGNPQPPPSRLLGVTAGPSTRSRSRPLIRPSSLPTSPTPSRS